MYKSFYESHKEFNCDTPDKCRFREGVSTTTLMYFEPIYDRQGNNLNPDRNWSENTITCSACNRSWLVRSNGAETKIK